MIPPAEFDQSRALANDPPPVLHSTPSVKQTHGAQQWLSDFRLEHTGAFVKDDARTRCIASADEVSHWRSRLLDLAQNGDASKPYHSIVLHSTAQYYFNNVFQRDWPNTYPDKAGAIHVDHLVFSGLAPFASNVICNPYCDSPRFAWAHLFSVGKAITLRGCKHLFADRSFSFLPDFELTGDRPVLTLIGGQDMDLTAVRECLLNITFTQRARLLMDKKPFAVINMHFPLRDDEKAKVEEAWNSFNDECRGEARLVVRTDQCYEYLGVEHERQYFAVAEAMTASVERKRKRKRASALAESQLDDQWFLDTLNDDSSETHHSTTSRATPHDASTAARSQPRESSLSRRSPDLDEPCACGCPAERVWAMDGDDAEMAFIPPEWPDTRDLRHITLRQRVHENINHKRIRKALNRVFGYDNRLMGLMLETSDDDSDAYPWGEEGW